MIARRVGGKRRPGSGNKWFAKHDVGSKIFLVEAKHTDKASYSIKRADVERVCVRAAEEGKVPAFVVGFSGKNYIMFDMDHVEFNEGGAIICPLF